MVAGMTQSEASQTLWFLAPGLAHLLGNALFTLHGRARLLAGALEHDAIAPQVSGDLRAIEDGAARAQAALHLLRWLIDEGGPGPVPVATVLHTLVEVARVPLRDRGLSLELAAETEPGPAHVEPASFCRWIGAMCRVLAGSVHGTPQARLALSWAAESGSVRVSCRLEAEPGAPPVPREAGLLAEALRAAFPTAAVRWESADGGGTLVAIVPN
jgi:hypothetical protein